MIFLPCSLGYPYPPPPPLFSWPPSDQSPEASSTEDHYNDFNGTDDNNARDAAVADLLLNLDASLGYTVVHVATPRGWDERDRLCQ